ncbi:M20/M25/M40 family metallo-hydrolase [Mucisphaera sp.]|uniref:M20/M25/M40 family metallo-hydrolase n=1 Tax=Mucisphaera sp. TaxID=2913024 RepID=UPI003D145D33
MTSQDQRKHPTKQELAVLKQLLGLPTSPFHEQHIADFVIRFARRYGWHTRADRFGNLRLTASPRSRPRLLLTAHMDHPGFWAIRMASADQLVAHWMGGVPARLMAGQPVRFWTGGKRMADNGCGPWSKSNTGLKLGGRVVDATFEEILETSERGSPSLVRLKVPEPVEPGAIGMWRLGPPAIHEGRIHARAVDDIAAVAALLCTLRRVARRTEPCPTGFLLTRAEEGGFFGAIDHCRNLKHPERAPLHVGLEMSMARREVPVGSGVIVRVGDRRMTYDPDVSSWLSAQSTRIASRDAGFRYQRQLMTGGSCESTVYQTYLGRAGALCLPLGNYHNIGENGQGIAPEYIDLSDFRDLVTLTSSLAQAGYRKSDLSSDPFLDWCESWADQHRHLYDDPAGHA